MHYAGWKWHCFFYFLSSPLPIILVSYTRAQLFLRRKNYNKYCFIQGFFSLHYECCCLWRIKCIMPAESGAVSSTLPIILVLYTWAHGSGIYPALPIPASSITPKAISVLDDAPSTPPPSLARSLHSSAGLLDERRYKHGVTVSAPIEKSSFQVNAVVTRCHGALGTRKFRI